MLVAVLVIALALRLMWQSVQVLMDRTSTDAEGRIRAALAGLREPLELRRVRVRHAAGRHFADLVVGVAPDKGVGQAHATADAIEDLVRDALGNADVVVHVEPVAPEGGLRERATAAARRRARGARGPQRPRHAGRRRATSSRSTSSCRASSASPRRTT